MNVKDIMSKNPKSLTPNMSMQEAAMMMDQYDFDTMPVMENNHIVGMISNHDIVMTSLSDKKDMKMTKINEMMTKKVISCHENDTMDKVAAMMAKNNIDGMPVLNAMGQMVGFITMHDIMHKAMAMKK